MIFKRINKIRSWYEEHRETRSVGQRLADSLTKSMGSWRFILIHTLLVTVWIVFNFIAFVKHWDPYPFILLNLLFSAQSAYTAPIILLSQNRQTDRDRAQAIAGYQADLTTKKEIEELTAGLHELALNNRLDKILTILEKWERERKGDDGIILNFSPH